MKVASLITGLSSKPRQGMVVTVCTPSGICNHVVRRGPSCLFSVNGLREFCCYSEMFQTKRRAHAFMIIHAPAGFTPGWRWPTPRCNVAGSTKPFAKYLFSLLLPDCLIHSTEKGTSKAPECVWWDSTVSWLNTWTPESNYWVQSLPSSPTLCRTLIIYLTSLSSDFFILNEEK